MPGRLQGAEEGLRGHLLPWELMLWEGRGLARTQVLREVTSALELCVQSQIQKTIATHNTQSTRLGPINPSCSKYQLRAAERSEKNRHGQSVLHMLV